MFLRLVGESIRRSPRRKAMTIAVVALGSSVATAMLGVMLDVGDRVNQELRSFGANLRVTPRSRALPVEIGGIRYQPRSSEDWIPEGSLPKLKSIFWQLNVTGLAPSLEAVAELSGRPVSLEGVWFKRNFRAPDGRTYQAGLRVINPTWRVEGRWIEDGEPDARATECLLGQALAKRLGMSLGSRLELLGESFTVSGILSTGGEEENRIFARLEVVQRLTHRPGQVDAVQVSALTKPEDELARKDRSAMTPSEYDRWYCSPYLTSIAHQIEEALPMAVAKPVYRVADNEGRILGKIRGLMLLVCLTALASAALTVWSVMAATVLERRREIAIMQATGAGNRVIAALFGAEIAVQGIVGGVLGALAGSRLAQWVGSSVFNAQIESPVLLVPLVVVLAVGAALAGAAQPLIRALSQPPAEVLRGGV